MKISVVCMKKAFCVCIMFIKLQSPSKKLFSGCCNINLVFHGGIIKKVPKTQKKLPHLFFRNKYSLVDKWL
jgi:hypothetical protein